MVHHYQISVHKYDPESGIFDVEINSHHVKVRLQEMPPSLSPLNPIPPIATFVNLPITLNGLAFPGILDAAGELCQRFKANYERAATASTMSKISNAKDDAQEDQSWSFVDDDPI